MQHLDGPTAAAVRPVVEHLTEKYTVLKKTVHDYLVSLSDDDLAWKNSYLPELAKQVGL